MAAPDPDLLIIVTALVVTVAAVATALAIIVSVLNRGVRRARPHVEQTCRRAAAAWAATRPQPAAFPVQLLSDRPGRFRVSGVIAATEQEVVWLIDAQSEANAVVKAELRGAVVTKVERCDGDAARQPAAV